MNECRWCGTLAHQGICPKIKAIEYEGDGVTVKRVEFMTPADLGPMLVVGHPLPGLQPPLVPSPTPWTPHWGTSIIGVGKPESIIPPAPVVMMGASQKGLIQ